MKTKIFSLLFFIPFLLSAQDRFTLLGKVGQDNSPAQAYLLYRDGKRIVTDSVKIVNGMFKFTGTIQEPVPARLIIDHKGVGFAGTTNSADMIMMYLAKGTIQVNSPDSLKRAVFPGSVINAEYNKYKTHMAGINREIEQINSNYNSKSGKSRKDSISLKRYEDESAAAYRRYKVLLFEFIKANPDSYVSLSVLREAASPVINVPVIEPVFNSLSSKLKASVAGKEFKETMEQRRALSVGRYAPVFTQNDQFDKPINLSDFRGKYVLIDFWASWCMPCRAENPHVVKAYNKFKDRNFTVIGVSLDRPGKKEDWIKAIQADGLVWTQVSDLKYWDNAVAKLYGIRSVPQNFLLDKEGKIIAENLRGEDLMNKLAELLEQAN
jgi:peroxiredoxin